MELGCNIIVGLVLLVFVGLAHGQGDFLRVRFSVLPHRYDCGDYSMQLVVFPSQGRAIRFKVVDEFGTPFEVTNCSICLHWITSGEEGAVIFSAGYNGCHVLKKVTFFPHLISYVACLLTGLPASTLTLPLRFKFVLPNPFTFPNAVIMFNPFFPPTAISSTSTFSTFETLCGHFHPCFSALVSCHIPTWKPCSSSATITVSSESPETSLSLLPGAHLTQQQCQVEGTKIPCVGGHDEQTACYQAGCCYDRTDPAMPCYYGNTVTVQCLRDGHFVLVVSKDMADYPVILDSVRLAYAQERCDPVSMSEVFVVFRFSLTQCGTTMIGNKLIYENQLVSGIDVRTGPDGSITRDSTFILHARCIYNASDFLPVQAEVLLPPAPALAAQVGPLRLELRIATDPRYSSYYADGDYPVVKVLRDPVYVEVRILERTDPSLVLVLHQCWATPSTNPLEYLQWPILVDGCPFLGDNYRTQLVPMGPVTSELLFPTHYQRFVISTFTFVDSASQMVYLFCSASACHPSQMEPCRTTCPAGAAASK
uniref:Zona pellucida sperm-binding protein 1 n=1 Tax=Sphenodon punctatus TaxID=8508 RepID=A0A8D0HPW9_SPHPU